MSKRASSKPVRAKPTCLKSARTAAAAAAAAAAWAVVAAAGGSQSVHRRRTGETITRRVPGYQRYVTLRRLSSAATTRTGGGANVVSRTYDGPKKSTYPPMSARHLWFRIFLVHRDACPPLVSESFLRVADASTFMRKASVRM